MIDHWLNELMNLLAGNSRYVQYSFQKKCLFAGGLLAFIGLSVYLLFLL